MGPATESLLPHEGLQVIGAGCGRTGTDSLKAALELLLGGKCYHTREMVTPKNILTGQSPKHFQFWLDVADGKADWDDMFGGTTRPGKFKATLDFPSSSFYKDLMKRYPDAKVILSIRPADAWYESVRNTIWNVGFSEFHWAYIALPCIFGRKFQRMCEMYRLRFLNQGPPGVPVSDPVSDREGIIRKFNSWNDEVRAVVPKERLLVHEAKDGWKPLCEFLNVPEPSIPYPRANSVTAWRCQMITLKILGMFFWFLPFFAAIAAVFLLLRPASTHGSGAHPLATAVADLSGAAATGLGGPMTPGVEPGAVARALRWLPQTRT